MAGFGVRIVNLPGHDEHKFFCIKILGYYFKDVDEWMDAYAVILGPKDHRRYRHSLEEIVEKYNPFKDPKRFNVAVLHLIVDMVFTVKQAKAILLPAREREREKIEEEVEEVEPEGTEKDYITEEIKV